MKNEKNVMRSAITGVAIAIACVVVLVSVRVGRSDKLDVVDSVPLDVDEISNGFDSTAIDEPDSVSGLSVLDIPNIDILTPEEEFLILNAPELHARITGVIGDIREKSLAQNLVALSEVDSYFWPGPKPDPGSISWHGVSAFPLAEKFGEEDVEAILSNRRFSRVFADISMLPKAEAARVVGFELQDALPIYQKLLENHNQKNSPLFKAEDLETQTVLDSPGFIIATGPGAETVLLGAKLKVLSLVWISGALELKELRTQIADIAALSVSQRDELYGASTLHEIYREEMLKKASLYNRQILATGLLGTRDMTGVDARADGEADTWKEYPLAQYDATLTLYDLPVKSRMMSPDLEGATMIRVHAPLSDDMFNTLLQE